VRTTRLLPAALLIVLSLAGCASGLNDATSREHATPWVADINVGPVQVRNVMVSPATSSTGTAQAYLSMALATTSSKPDELTGATISGGGTVTPTAGGASFTITPNQLLIIPNPESGSASTGPGLAITGLTASPQVGTTMTVTLTFRDAGSVQVHAPVRPSVVA